MINPRVELEGMTLEADGERFCGNWNVPHGLSYFEGHFPGMPVLPAVGVIDLSVEAVRQALGVSAAELRELNAAKFTAPITPGLPVRIELERTEDVWRVRWLGEKLLADLSFRIH